MYHVPTCLFQPTHLLIFDQISHLHVYYTLHIYRFSMKNHTYTIISPYTSIWHTRLLCYTNDYFNFSYPSCFCKVWLWTNKEFQQMKSSWIPYKVRVIHPFVICSQPKSFSALCCIQIQCWFQKRMLPLQYLFHKQGNILRSIVNCLSEARPVVKVCLVVVVYM